MQRPASAGTLTPMLRVDPFDIYSVVNGTMRLDGGAMFGVVPKVLWSPLVDVDDDNRILLATRTLIAVDRAAGRVVLVDTGCGSKWAPDLAKRYGISADPTAIDRRLHGLGLSSAAVTDVVVTHLHFDHNGGLTDWVDAPGGRTKLRYPQARHWLHRGHWEQARHPHAKEKPSFIEADFAGLEESGVVAWVDGPDPAPPLAGMAWLLSHGHTACQLHPVFGIGGAKLVFVGDMVPTAAHVRPSWVMAYDVLPMTTIDEKQSLYRRCTQDGWRLAFAHDPSIAGVAIGGRPERPTVTGRLEF